MARIRSVHPSLFKDEKWVSVSPLARIVYIGLLTEADDQGVFEWKPMQLKLEILPGEAVDRIGMTALLDELKAEDLIQPFEAAGKPLGAIRRFQRFQRPKKPSVKWPLPPEWRTYVGADEEGGEGGDAEDGDVPPPSPVGGEPVPHHDGSGSENRKQMEDGEGGGKINPPTPLRGGARAGSEPVVVSWPSKTCEAAWKALPIDATAHCNPIQFGDAWRTMVPVLEAEGRTTAEADLLFAACAAAKHFGMPGKAKRMPAAHRWLGLGKFRVFLPEITPCWPGPAELRAEVVRALGEHGEAFAKTILDARCGWQDSPVKAVLCETSWIRGKLAESPAAAVFERHGVALLRKEAAA